MGEDVGVNDRYAECSESRQAVGFARGDSAGEGDAKEQGY